MRQAFCEALHRETGRPEFLFLTGDLGFMALEGLRERMGSRFLNAGVAEQNMVSVAAGLARKGLRPWVYSIAPFLYARPFEQIRNDVCLHGLPVILVGNGGGYGYGVMGATHHALEDYGVLLTLPAMEVFIPAFDSDLEAVIPELFRSNSPAYLRLGLGEQPRGSQAAPFAGWRKLMNGRNGTVIAVGPLSGACWSAWTGLPEERRPELWCLCRLPIPELPDELWQRLANTSALAIAEEHTAHGSAGQALSMMLLRRGCVPSRVQHVTALGYPSGTYGSQRFHRAECGLDPASLLATLTEERGR